MIERLQRGLEGYRNIARHAVSAEAAAQIMAETSSADAGRTGEDGSPTAGP
jgi:hypothetical protein